MSRALLEMQQLCILVGPLGVEWGRSVSWRVRGSWMHFAPLRMQSRVTSIGMCAGWCLAPDGSCAGVDPICPTEVVPAGRHMHTQGRLAHRPFSDP